jgi:hypothetical protein
LERFGTNFGINRTWWFFSIIPFFFVVRRKTVGSASLFMVFVVFLFFSLAATKMPAFTLIALALIFIIFASMLTAFERLINEMIPLRFFRILLFTSVLLYLFTGVFKLNEKYTSLYITEDDRFSYPYQREIYADWFREFIRTVPPEEQHRMVILNCPGEQTVHMMYLTGIRAAYSHADSLERSILKNRKDLVIGYLVYPDQAVPSDIASDENILKIPVGKGITSSTTGAYSK